VDGTDCKIGEPTDWDKTWFSHKFKGPAVKYEVAVCIEKGHIVWTNGPFRGSVNDLKIFKSDLANRVPPGKIVIADKGYRSIAFASTPNDLDSPDVMDYKKRVRARQESVNKRLKDFKVLKETFRHPRHKHKAVFEACAVIVQNNIEVDSPLFTI
jgi:hypothetical protein